MGKKEPNWMVKLALQNKAFVKMMKPLNPLQEKYHLTVVKTQDKELEDLTLEDMEKMVEWAKNQKS
jgi:hypothetical protein